MKSRIILPLLLCVVLLWAVTPALAGLNLRVYKFHDDNANGVQDEGEVYLEGWLIRIYSDLSSPPVAEGLTGSDGIVYFADLPVGAGVSYIVWEEMPECWSPTAPPDMMPCDGGYCTVVSAEACGTTCLRLGNKYACEDSCRVTAGGNKDGVYCPVLRNGEADPDYCELDVGPEITHTWGGQAGAPPRIDGNWTHRYLDKGENPHNKFTFHSNELFYIQCSDPGQFCQPARFAPTRQIDFAGIGRFTNKKGGFKDAPDGDLCFKVHLEDIGEPGPGGRWPNADEPCTHCPGTEVVEPDCTNCTDYYEIEIYDSDAHNVETGECLGALIWQNGDQVSGNCGESETYVAPFAPYEGFFTRAGNVQIHPDNNGP